MMFLPAALSSQGAAQLAVANGGTFFPMVKPMTTATYTEQNVKTAKRNAGLRKRREQDVLRIITEYKQGRGASSCMADIIKAFERK